MSTAPTPAPPSAPRQTREQLINELADSLAQSEACDVLLINHGVDHGLDRKVHSARSKRQRNVQRLYLILTTSGGNPDVAYKTMRYLQNLYPERVTVVVPGWCKSAGTLMVIGAHEILFGPFGELGPLDVQLVRPDAMGEASSGLAIDTAVEKLQHEAFKLMIGFMTEASQSEFRFSFKAAADIATKATVGLFQPIFEKLDPIQIGEDYRSFKIAEAYAERLDTKARNLRRVGGPDGLRALLEGYPSHGFTIDFEEAGDLFQNVKIVTGNMMRMVALMGVNALYPADRLQGKDVVKYLNTDEPQDDQGTENTKKGGSDAGSNEGVSGAVAAPAARAADRKADSGAGTGKKPEPKASEGKARKPRGKPRGS